jgi:hypothetical protein
MAVCELREKVPEMDQQQMTDRPAILFGNFSPPRAGPSLQELCDDHDMLLICDKIATGFGRTGKMFAVEHAKDFAPNIMCIGKAQLGSFFSFVAMLSLQPFAEVFSQGPVGVFMHLSHCYLSAKDRLDQDLFGWIFKVKM